MNDSYLEVLQQYEGETLNVRRGRDAWICERSDGLRLLKEYRGTRKRLEFEEAVLGELQQQGMAFVDQYQRTREQELISTAGDGTKYILKQWWFSHRECNLKDSREILFCISRIAGLHRILRRIVWQEEWDLGSILPPGLSSEMQRHTREMKRARNFITGKRRKNAFETCVVQHFSSFYDQACAAQTGLKSLEEEQQQSRFFLCHGNLDQHHVLVGPKDAAFIEFSQMHRGWQMEDLYRFMRKVMEKHDWNVSLGLDMVEIYDRTNPLDPADRSCLYYLFLYPEKYWKQLNYYYNANKAWIPAKNVEKLKVLESQEESRGRFLEKLR